MSVEVELDDDGSHIVINANMRYKELCKSIPGANWSAKQARWRMPVSWGGCLALRSTFRNELVIGPKLTEWATHELATRIGPANALREVVSLDEGDPDLFPHQRAGVAFLATARRALLADQPGLGKSAQAIRTLTELVRRGENPFPALVVCPNTLKTGWKREFEKWWPGVNVLIIGGTPVARRKQFAWVTESKEVCPIHGTPPAPVEPKKKRLKKGEVAPEPEPQPEPSEPVCVCVHVVVVNWESMRSHSRLAPYGGIALAKCKDHGGEDEKISATRCEVHPRELNGINFAAVIADEIHRAKDPKSKQTRALWAATGDADVRIALTGTPIAETVVDLWPIMHWLDEAEWPSKSRWIDRSVDTMMNSFGGLHILGIKAQMRDEFFATINPRMRRMLKQVVLPFLPPILHEERFVEQSPKQRKAYEQMRDFMIAELEDGDTLMAPSPLTQMTRLLQFSVAFAELVEDPVSGETVTQLSDPSATLDAVMDDIENGDFGEDSVAISAGGPGSKQLLLLLSARLTKANIRHGMITGDHSPDVRQKSIDEFQSGDVKFILYTVSAGGVGVTLTKARRLLRLLRPYSLIDDLQANDRVHRIGSEIHDSIMITDYIVEDTVQQRVQDILNEKAENAEVVLRDRNQVLNLLRADKEKK